MQDFESGLAALRRRVRSCANGRPDGREIIECMDGERRPVHMGKAYSQDLRDRVPDTVEVEGQPCRAAAKRFGIHNFRRLPWPPKNGIDKI